MKKLLTLLLAVIAGSSLSGCTKINLSQMWQEYNTPVADNRHPVLDVMCLWEEAEGHDLEGMPTRGFAGQILFFTVARNAPARVDGDVRIILFDELGVNGDASLPLHQFDFPGAAWNQFQTTTNFGAAYQLFIPYTRKGADRANCQIRVRYTPKEGKTVYSRPCNVTLSGPKRGAELSGTMEQSSGSAATFKMPSGVVPISHEVVVNEPQTQLGQSLTPPAPKPRVNRLDQVANEMLSKTAPPTLSAIDAKPVEIEKPRRKLHPLAPNPLAEPEAAPASTDPESPAAETPKSKHLLLD
jgi:hypothetical protein